MKKSSVLKSAFCIVFSLILLLSVVVYAPAINGKTEKAANNIISFKDYPYKAPTGNTSLNTVTIEEGENVGMDDNFVLHFKLDTDDSYTDSEGAIIAAGNRISHREHCALIGSVTNGNIYRVTYYYKTGAENTAKYNIYLSTASASNIWSNYAKINSTEQQITAKESEWTKATTIFVAEPVKDSANGLYINFTFSTGKANNMADSYVDNVTVEEFAGSVILFHSNVDGIDDVIASGNAGENITFPTISNGKNPFLGWFTNKECTIPFTETALSGGITHVYALWGDGPLTFEGYPYNTVPSHSFGKTMSIVNEEGIGTDDDFALRFKFDGSEIHSIDEDGNPVYMASRAAHREHIATLGTVKDNTVYKVSYYIKSGENCKTSYSTVLATAHKNNIWASYIRYDDTITYHKVEGKEWTKVTHYFQTKFAKKDGDTLFIQFNSSNSTTSAFAEVYFDYVEIEELDGSVVFFHPNIGTLENIVINGKTSEEFTYPEFKNGRSEIIGWYTDKECTASFVSNSFPEGITHLYAKWSNAPLTFENYPYSTTQSGVFGLKTMSIVNEKGIGYDDNAALRFRFDGSEIYGYDENGNPVYMNTRYAARDHVATLGKIQKGAVYKVSYYYKSAKDNQTSYTIHLASSVNNNIWGNNYTKFSDTRVNGSSSIKEWTKASFILDTSVIADNADTLYIMFNPSSSTIDAYSEVYFDHFTIEKIEVPFILINANNSSELKILQGKVGDEIPFPTVTRHGYTFAGWYTDTELKNKFDAKEFTDGMNVNIYAKWNKLSSVLYNFENFDIPSHEESGYYLLEDSKQYKTNVAFSGKNVIMFDRTGEYHSNSSWMPIADSKEIFQVEKGKKYAVSANYYVAKELEENVTVSLKAASNTNYWSNSYLFEQKLTIFSTSKVGRWNNIVFFIDANEIKENGTSLYLIMQGGKGGIVYFDDVLITEVPNGYGVVGIQKENCTNIAPFVIGKIGSNYYSKLSQKAKVSGKYFKGYYTQEGGAWVTVNDEKAFFTKELITISARFLDYSVTQDFEGVYYENSKEWEAYTFYDFDYEVYDSEAPGNSKDNVTSGRYSLHRKGDSMFFENASILTWGEEIAEGERYTVTMKVKMGKHAHTDGAIKIASGRSFRYQWSTSGDYYAVVPIADLTDGNWHEITYTFNSVEGYAVIQTPGHVELFIDDIEFKLVNEITPLTFQPNYTEYVPAKLDEAGNLIRVNGTVDVSSIIDESLYAKQNIFASLIFYIVMGGVSIIIASVVIILITRKKKKA